MSTHADTHAHDHPGPMTYLRIAVVLFALTAAEVYGYEAGHRAELPLHDFFASYFTPTLLFLSAWKFALVAMFYMHLKQDSKLFSGLFVFPIILAIGVAAALMGLFSIVHLMVK